MGGKRHAPGRSLRAVLAAVLLAMPFVWSVALPVAPASADQLGDAQQQQQALQQRIKQQRSDLAALQAAEAQLKAALDQTRQQLNAINANQAQLATQITQATAALAVVHAHYRDLVSELAHLDWTLGILDNEQQQAQDELAARRRLLASRLAQAYQTQQTSLLEQLLSADSFTTVLSQVSDYLSQGDQDAALATEIQQDQQALDLLQATTQAARFQTDQVRAQVAQQAVQMQAQEAALVVARHQLDILEAQTKRLQAQQLAAFRKAQANHTQATALLKQEQRSEADLQHQIDALIAAQAQGGGIPSQYSGAFSWPLVGTITQEFGCTGFPAEPPLGDCAHFHRGIDIAAYAGAPIHAAGDGVVEFVGYNPYDPPGRRAWIVIVAHATNLQTWYAHMIPKIPSGIYVGAHVSQGQVVGWEGCTGNCTGPHLHWAVLLNDTWVNPRLFL
ncbi:MAG: murein hydrolase activator EnvC family protein [Candidatus Limnocylindrales bacterium]